MEPHVRNRDELTPEPLAFRDIAKQLKRSGFSYDRSLCCYKYTDACGIEWRSRLRETGWGIQIDTHYVDEEGQERLV